MKKLLTRDIPPRAALAVAVLALVATVVSGREKPDLAPEPAPAAASSAAASSRAAAPAATSPAASAEAAPELDTSRLLRARTDQAIADLFAAPAAPAPGAAAPAPRPSAPPLPFQFVARIVDGAGTSVYVMLGEDNYSVKPGLVIDRNYRVEQVTDSAVTFTYLPMGTRQVLSLLN